MDLQTHLESFSNIAVALKRLWYIKSWKTGQILCADIPYFSSRNALVKILQELQEKVLFPCIPARSCETSWDLAGILQESCLKLLQDSYKIPAKSHKILQECKKKQFSCNSCNISCKSIFTGFAGSVTYTCWTDQQLFSFQWLF